MLIKCIVSFGSESIYCKLKHYLHYLIFVFTMDLFYTKNVIRGVISGSLFMENL